MSRPSFILPFAFLGVVGALAVPAIYGLRPGVVIEGFAPLAATNAAACKSVGEAQYDFIETAGGYSDTQFAKEGAAIERSLALQRQRLDRFSPFMGSGTRSDLARLYGAESALCDLAVHPRGSLISYGAEKSRAYTEYQELRAQLRATLGSAFDQPPTAADLAAVAWPAAPDPFASTKQDDAQLDRDARAAVAEAERNLAERDRLELAPSMPYQPPAAPGAGTTTATPEPVALRWSQPRQAPPIAASDDWLAGRRLAVQTAIDQLGEAKAGIRQIGADIGSACATGQAVLARLAALDLGARPAGAQALDWLQRSRSGCETSSAASVVLDYGEARAALGKLLGPGAG